MGRCLALLTRAVACRWSAFVLLVLAGAARWLLEAKVPAARSTEASECVGCVVAAGVLCAVALSRGCRPEPLRGSGVRRKPGVVAASWGKTLPTDEAPRHIYREEARSRRLSSGRRKLRPLLAGSMFLGGPAMALLVPPRGGAASDFVLALSLTPVVVCVAAPALGATGSTGMGERVWQGLAASAGLLMLLAPPSLHPLRPEMTYGLGPLLAGVGAVFFCAEESATADATALALSGGGAVFAVALAVAVLRGGALPRISWIACAADGLLALLEVGALAQLGPLRWSAQYAVVPLLIVVQGMVMLHSPLTVRTVAGLGLLMASSAFLLRGSADGEGPRALTIR